MKIIKMKNGIRASVSEQQAAIFVALRLAVIEDEPVVKKPVSAPPPIPDPDLDPGIYISGKRQKRKYHRRDMERED